jgi:hypothetical protein
MKSENVRQENAVDNTVKLINIEISVDELNIVLGALQELPHRVVDKLLKNIFEQAQKQI